LVKAYAAEPLKSGGSAGLSRYEPDPIAALKEAKNGPPN
jgi:hypothetical protein